MKDYFNYCPSDSKGKYSVILTDSLEGNIKDKIEQYVCQYKSLVFVIDKNLPKSYRNILNNFIKLSGKKILYIDPSTKTLDKIVKIWKLMVSSVSDAVVALGGGTVCDLVGFASATYQRGIPRILFPTTVLSMVDASIGGKTGIDFNGVKNSVGAIHYPTIVVNYLPFLSSQKDEDYNSGFSEIIKAAVLYDRVFFEDLMIFSKLKRKLTEKETLKILLTSSKLKAKVCEDDKKKKISLLYGHSIGHALEIYNNVYQRHGDCVSIGMNIEGAIACLLGVWNEKEWRDQLNLLRFYNLPTKLPKNIKLLNLTKKMLLYKKLVSKDYYLFSVPKKIGEINNSHLDYLTSVKKEKMIPLLKTSLKWMEEKN